MTSTEEMVKHWNDGECIPSFELGGIGPGYEQAIQELLWEIITRLHKKEYTEDDWDKYFDESQDIMSELNDMFGFSGAQAGAAYECAFQILVHGWDEMRDENQDRIIIVSKSKFWGWWSDE